MTTTHLPSHSGLYKRRLHIEDSPFLLLFSRFIFLRVALLILALSCTLRPSRLNSLLTVLLSCSCFVLSRVSLLVLTPSWALRPSTLNSSLTVPLSCFVLPTVLVITFAFILATGPSVLEPNLVSDPLLLADDLSEPSSLQASLWLSSSIAIFAIFSAAKKSSKASLMASSCTCVGGRFRRFFPFLVEFLRSGLLLALRGPSVGVEVGRFRFGACLHAMPIIEWSIRCLSWQGVTYILQQLYYTYLPSMRAYDCTILASNAEQSLYALNTNGFAWPLLSQCNTHYRDSIAHTIASMVGNRENSLSGSIPTFVALLLVSEEKTEEEILTDMQFKTCNTWLTSALCDSLYYDKAVRYRTTCSCVWYGHIGLKWVNSMSNHWRWHLHDAQAIT